MSVRWKGGTGEKTDTRREFFLCLYFCQSVVLIKFHSIIERFQNLGYIEEDIKGIGGQKEVDQETELTDRSKHFLVHVFHHAILTITPKSGIGSSLSLSHSYSARKLSVWNKNVLPSSKVGLGSWI
jgi:hypothetical protein